MSMPRPLKHTGLETLTHTKFIYLSGVGYLKYSKAQILYIQWLVKNELENMWMETVVVILWYSPDLVLVRTSSFWAKI